MDEKKYECVFNLPSKITDYCPVRTVWKSTPETMVEFCKLCPHLVKYTHLIAHRAEMLEFVAKTKAIEKGRVEKALLELLKA